MKLVELIAELIGKWLLGWIAGRRAAKQQQQQIDTINHDEQVIVDQKQTIEVGETRNEIERDNVDRNRADLVNRLRAQHAIREDDSAN